MKGNTNMKYLFLTLIVLLLLPLRALAADPQFVVTRCDDTSIPFGCVAVDLVDADTGEEFASAAFNLNKPTDLLSVTKGAALQSGQVLTVVEQDDYVRVVIAPPFSIPIETFEAGELAVVCFDTSIYSCEAIGFFDWDAPPSSGDGYDVGDALGQDVPMATPKIVDGGAFFEEREPPACGLIGLEALLVPLVAFGVRRRRNQTR